MKNDNFKEKFNERLVNFSLETIKLCELLKKDDARIIADQLLRSATSVGANIFEAKASNSKKDYIYFFHIALKSANETLYWLILVKKSKAKFYNLANKLYNEAEEISKILGSGIITMKKKQ